MTEIKYKVITKDAFALPYTIIQAKNQPTKGVIVYIHGGRLMLVKLTIYPTVYRYPYGTLRFNSTKLSFITRSKSRLHY